jgi:hypothetical protein
MVIDTTAVRTKGSGGGSCSSTASGAPSRRGSCSCSAAAIGARLGGTRGGQSKLSVIEAVESEPSSDESEDEDGYKSSAPAAAAARPRRRRPSPQQAQGLGGVQTLAQELIARLRHTENLSARQQKQHQTDRTSEFYSDVGIMTRMDLLEKESIKKALEDLWIAANCVDPTDEIIDKQELTLAPRPYKGPGPSPSLCPRWLT